MSIVVKTTRGHIFLTIAILYITVADFSYTAAHNHAHINLTNCRKLSEQSWQTNGEGIYDRGLESTAHRVAENITKSLFYIFNYFTHCALAGDELCSSTVVNF